MAHCFRKHDNVPFFMLPSAWDFAILHCVMAKQSNLSFFGREEIIDRLETLWGKRVPSLVTCRGRRRIGKTTLIEKFANRSKARFIKLEGLKPKDKMSNADQLSAFASQLALQTHAERTIPPDWLSAFARLDGEIRDEGRTVAYCDPVRLDGLGLEQGLLRRDVRGFPESGVGQSVQEAPPPRTGCLRERFVVDQGLDHR